MSTPAISRAERAYIQAALLAPAPRRADGRGLADMRAIALEMGVVPLANGSARVGVGGGTDVLVAVKLEVERAEDDGATAAGRVTCAVSCSPAAYPHLASTALDDLAHELSTLLQATLGHPSLMPDNLVIVPGARAWRVHVDALVRADAGGVPAALFLAARAALRDTRVPATRAVAFRPPERGGGGGGDGMDAEPTARSGLDTRAAPAPADFELLDYWDEGVPLGGGAGWPVCVTLHLLPPVYFLDATLAEEAAAPLRLLLAFSFPRGAAGPATLQAMRMLGAAELEPALLQSAIADGEKHARELHAALDAKIADEDARRGEKARALFARVRA